MEGETKRVVKKSLSKILKLKELAAQLKIDPEVLRSPDRGWKISRVRTLVAYVLVRRLGFSVSEVAGYMGRDAATVSSLITRLSERLQRDPQIQREVERLTKFV